MIDKSGEWWKGEDFSDLTAYVAAYTAQNYTADVITQSECASCHGTVFGLVVDDAHGCARRTCRTCSIAAFIADSHDFWDEAERGEAACPCGGEEFETAIGFSLIDRGEIRWITVGGRCIACGIFVVYAEWKIEYEPSRHLLALT